MVVVIANVIDFIAAMIQVGSGAIKKKTKILIVQIVQLMLQALSMLMLGGITGAISNVLSCFRNYICFKDKLNIAWKVFFIAASVIMTIVFNTQGLLGIIPAVVCTLYIIFMDVKDQLKFKLLVTVSFIPWIIYHFAIRSYTGAIFDAASVVTNAVTLFKMYGENKKQGDLEGSN